MSFINMSINKISFLYFFSQFLYLFLEIAIFFLAIYLGACFLRKLAKVNNFLNKPAKISLICLLSIILFFLSSTIIALLYGEVREEINLSIFTLFIFIMIYILYKKNFIKRAELKNIFIVLFILFLFLFGITLLFINNFEKTTPTPGVVDHVDLLPTFKP